jgi:GTP-binding protein HflX
VGFIADLPVELVAAFRATLEEVLEADVIAHVRDASHAESSAQKVDVLKVLHELGVEAGTDQPFVEILNKIDLLAADVRMGLLAANARPDGPVAVSAVSGDGLDALQTRFETELTGANIRFRLMLPHADGESLAWVYRHAQVLKRADKPKGVELTLAIDPQDVGRFSNRFASDVLTKTVG